MLLAVCHALGNDTSTYIVDGHDWIQCAAPQFHRDVVCSYFALGSTAAMHHCLCTRIDQRIWVPDPFRVQGPAWCVSNKIEKIINEMQKCCVNKNLLQVIK